MGSQDSVQARLVRLESGQDFTNKMVEGTNKAVDEIKEDLKATRNAVRAMLFSLIVGLVVMIAGFILSAGAR